MSDIILGDPVPEPPDYSEAILQVRELSGVSSTEYELDGETYWTDEQIEAMLVRVTPEDADPDVEVAAATILDAWAAQLARVYDVTMDGQSLARSQMMQAVRERAEEIRARAGIDGITSIATESDEAILSPVPKLSRWYYRRRWKGYHYK
jgi:hypothetical protein